MRKQEKSSFDQLWAKKCSYKRTQELTDMDIISFIEQHQDQHKDYHKDQIQEEKQERKPLEQVRMTQSQVMNWLQRLMDSNPMEQEKKEKPLEQEAQTRKLSEMVDTLSDMLNEEYVQRHLYARLLFKLSVVDRPDSRNTLLQHEKKMSDEFMEVVLQPKMERARILSEIDQQMANGHAINEQRRQRGRPSRKVRRVNPIRKNHCPRKGPGPIRRRQIKRSISDVFTETPPKLAPGGVFIRDCIISFKELDLKVEDGRGMEQIRAINDRLLKSLKVTWKKFENMYVYKVPAYRADDQWFMPRLTGVDLLKQRRLAFLVLHETWGKFDYVTSQSRFNTFDQRIVTCRLEDAVKKEVKLGRDYMSVQLVFDQRLDSTIISRMRDALRSNRCYNVWSPHFLHSAIESENGWKNFSEQTIERFVSILYFTRRSQYIKRIPSDYDKALQFMEHFVQGGQWKCHLKHQNLVGFLMSLVPQGKQFIVLSIATQPLMKNLINSALLSPNKMLGCIDQHIDLL